jgi:hypothetical protein
MSKVKGVRLLHEDEKGRAVLEVQPGQYTFEADL